MRLLWIISLVQPIEQNPPGYDHDSDDETDNSELTDEIQQHVDDARAILRLGATVSNYAIYVGITMPHFQILSEYRGTMLSKGESAQRLVRLPLTDAASHLSCRSADAAQRGLATHYPANRTDNCRNILL